MPRKPTAAPREQAEPPPASGPSPTTSGKAFGDQARARHAADPVFEQLAGAILEGSLPPGSALPTERELAERFGVSRLTARQAVHRLADMGLVRVRQGARPRWSTRTTRGISA